MKTWAAAISIAVLGLMLVPAGSTAAISYDGGWRVPVPNGTEVGMVGYGLGVDAADNVHVGVDLDFTGSVRRFAPDGTKLGRTKLDPPYISDIAFTEDGTILVAGFAGVQRFTPDGERLRPWKAEKGKPSPMRSGASGIDVAPDGSIYVVGYDLLGVVELDADGHYIRSFGKSDPRTGWRHQYEDVAVAPDGSLWATDGVNAVVRRFGPNGTNLGIWSKTGLRGGQFLYPERIAIADDGTIYISDDGPGRIQKLSPSGKFIDQWGSRGTIKGRFDGIAGLDVDSAGNVYVADRSGRVQRFRSDSEPPAPFAALTVGVTEGSYFVDGRMRMKLTVGSYGNEAVRDVRICPPRDRASAKYFVDGTACRHLGNMGEGAKRIVTFRLEAPNDYVFPRSINFKFSSANAGKGKISEFVYTLPN